MVVVNFLLSHERFSLNSKTASWVRVLASCHSQTHTAPCVTQVSLPKFSICLRVTGSPNSNRLGVAAL